MRALTAESFLEELWKALAAATIDPARWPDASYRTHVNARGGFARPRPARTRAEVMVVPGCRRTADPLRVRQSVSPSG